MKKRILLVDDDPAVRHMLARVLADEDYLVISAADVREALKTVAGKGIDLALVDANMPADGNESLERFARENPKLPVIITTRSSNITVTRSGISLLMEKPLDLPKLLGNIRRLLAPA